MAKLSQNEGDGVPNAGPSFASLAQSIAHHDAAIENLGSRMTGVEGGLRVLQGEVHSGFAGINSVMHKMDSKIDRFDARPQFDFHKTVGTVTTLAVLFSMVCGGIIWISSSHFATTIAEQRAKIQNLEEKIGWAARVDKGGLE